MNYELKKYVPILKKWDFAFFLVTMNYELKNKPTHSLRRLIHQIT